MESSRQAVVGGRIADFLLSPEGQKLLEDLYFGSAKKDYGFKRWHPEKDGTLAHTKKRWKDGTN